MTPTPRGATRTVGRERFSPARRGSGCWPSPWPFPWTTSVDVKGRDLGRRSAIGSALHGFYRGGECTFLKAGGMGERSLGRLERIRTFFLALPPAAALAALAALDWGAAGGCGSGREGGGVSDRDRGGKNPSGSFSARPGPDDAPGSPLATRRRAHSSADGLGGISRRGRVTHHLRRYSPSSCKENERGRDLGLKHRGRGESADR
jgi:hypothetical protein